MKLILGRKHTYHNDVKSGVLKIIEQRYLPGTPITDDIWNLAYDIYWADRALETLDFKLRHHIGAMA